MYTYALPDEGNYAQPTVTADRGALHLEARYNYEDRKTGSVWVGRNFGGVDAVAPGYKGALSWRRFEASSEGEYVFDTGESTNSFFYNWSELTFAPLEWLRGGVVTQRRRVYKSDREIQRGLLVGATYQRLDVTTYMFNPDDSKPTVVVAVSLSW